MTTHFRTLLLLGFTALTVSLSGCFVETTHDRGGGPECAAYQYFQVYWSVDNGNPNAPLLCGQVPPSHVELVTNNGTYQVGVECRATPYMGFVFDFSGSTVRRNSGRNLCHQRESGERQQWRHSFHGPRRRPVLDSGV